MKAALYTSFNSNPELFKALGSPSSTTGVALFIMLPTAGALRLLETLRDECASAAAHMCAPRMHTLRCPLMHLRACRRHAARGLDGVGRGVLCADWQ